MRSRKALSTVISTILLIALTVVLAAMVFSIVNTFIQDKTQGGYECFETIGNVLINPEYTCYNTSTNELKFAIKIKDINITKLLISISDNSNSKTFELTHFAQNIGLEYPDGTNLVKIPGAKSQKVYVFNYADAGLNIPSLIRIAPFSAGKQCDVTDEIRSIRQC